ncbi:MAG: 4Fe-4S binding protein [Candidatus Aenigmatarchaeota archaeon]
MKLEILRRIVRILSFIIIIYGGMIAYYFGIRNFPVIPISLPISYAAGEKTFFDKNYGIHFFEDILMTQLPIYLILTTSIVFLISLILFGSSWCGWICPLGVLQDGISFVRRFFKINGFKLSKKIEKFFDYYRYFNLFSILLLSFLIGDYFINITNISSFRDLHGKVSVSKTSCPGTALCFVRGELETTIKRLTPPSQPIRLFFYFLGLFSLTLYLGSFFIDRLYCRICPTGAINFLFNRGSFLSIEKNTQKCTKCKVCLEVCPMGQEKIYKEKISKNVDSYRCLKCFKCVEKCPEDNALQIKLGKYTIFSSKFKKVEE